MALAKTTITNQGFEATNAYHRVENIVLASKTQLCFHVRSYKTVAYPFYEEKVYECAYDLLGLNPIEQAYKYLKTTPEFLDAKDC